MQKGFLFCIHTQMLRSTHMSCFVTHNCFSSFQPHTHHLPYWLVSGFFWTHFSVSNDSWNALVLFMILSFSPTHTYTGGLDFFLKKRMYLHKYQSFHCLLAAGVFILCWHIFDIIFLRHMLCRGCTASTAKSHFRSLAPIYRLVNSSMFDSSNSVLPRITRD